MAKLNSIEDAEVLILRAMCRGTREGSVRTEAVRDLSRYVWREPIHQTMFNCLGMIAAADPDELRLLLISCLTRKGFPDVDLEAFFKPRRVSRQEVADSIQKLITPG